MGARLYCRGDGGGDGGAAERKAAEEARQAAAIARLNQTFGSGDRESLYGKFAEDSKALQLDDLTKDRGLAERDVGFDLARRGLMGGSREIDTGREIEDQFNRGVLTADNNAQGVANTARINDEGTRVSLMNSIRSGMGEADAASAAFTAMQNNARDAQTQARNQNVGGFFDAIRGAAASGQQRQAYEDEFKKYRTGGGASGGGSYGGSVRSVG